MSWIRSAFPFAFVLLLGGGGTISSCGKQTAAVLNGNSGVGYSYLPTLSGTKGTQGDANGVVIVGKGKLKVENSLVYDATGKPILPAFLQKEKELLRLVATAFEPKSLDELKKEVKICDELYADTLNCSIPDSYMNQKVRFYLTLLRFNAKTKSNEIVQTVPVDFYVETFGSGLEWAAGDKFVPAALNAKIDLGIEVTLKGGALAETPLAEYTSDGSTWKPIAVEDWRNASGDQYLFSVKYPFADEQHFRLRLKAKDTLGNESVSPESNNLVGQPDLVSLLTVSEQVRTACKDAQQRGASHLDIVLASRVLCRKKAPDGSLLSDVRVPVYFQNRGSVPMLFPTGVETLTYSVEYTVSGSNDIRYADVPHAPFSASDFTGGDPKIVYVPLEAARLTASAIKIVFDKTMTGRYSTSGTAAQDNTCYPAGEPYPTLQIAPTTLLNPGVACGE